MHLSLPICHHFYPFLRTPGKFVAWNECSPVEIQLLQQDGLIDKAPSFNSSSCCLRFGPICLRPCDISLGHSVDCRLLLSPRSHAIHLDDQFQLTVQLALEEEEE